MTMAWMLVRWVRDYGEDAPMDVVCWMPPEPGIPKRCLCGADFGYPPPAADARQIQCSGPWRHVWRDAISEIGSRVRAHELAAVAFETGESGRSTSAPAPATSTGPEDKTPVERPDSNKSGRSDVDPYEEPTSKTVGNVHDLLKKGGCDGDA